MSDKLFDKNSVEYLREQVRCVIHLSRKHEVDALVPVRPIRNIRMKGNIVMEKGKLYLAHPKMINLKAFTSDKDRLCHSVYNVEAQCYCACPASSLKFV